MRKKLMQGGDVQQLKRQLAESEGVIQDMRRAKDQLEKEHIGVQKQLQEDILNHRNEIRKLEKIQEQYK
jgi:hypothetical protein